MRTESRRQRLPVGSITYNSPVAVSHLPTTTCVNSARESRLREGSPGEPRRHTETRRGRKNFPRAVPGPETRLGVPYVCGRGRSRVRSPSRDASMPYSCEAVRYGRRGPERPGFPPSTSPGTSGIPPAGVGGSGGEGRGVCYSNTGSKPSSRSRAVSNSLIRISLNDSNEFQVAESTASRQAPIDFSPYAIVACCLNSASSVQSDPMNSLRMLWWSP